MYKRQGLLIVFSSPSGAGKSTLAQRLIHSEPEISFSVSATTRPPREGEKDGVDYHFIDRKNFEKLVAQNAMLEHATVFGNLYGTPQKPVLEAINKGQDILFDIDWQGGQQIRNSTLSNHVVSIFILPPSIAALKTRLYGRAKDNSDVISKRMEQAQSEISHWAEYDYVIVNHDLDQAEADIRQIIAAERLRRTRQPQLQDFVRELEQEFYGERKP